MTQISAGIDFGTTNTTAAMTGGGMPPQIVPLDNNHDDTPSTLFFEEKTNKVFFGRAASKKYMDGDPGRFMRSLKRVLGTGLMKSGTVINGKSTTFQEIIGTFIKNVKDKLDAVAGQNIECVVMGRPVHFRDNDPAGDKRAEQELERAATAAGFKNILFQYEPIAGAFAHERHLKTEQLAAVIDIGGGTSDFTIIRLGGDRAKKIDRGDDILANTGVRIGGNDFDKQLSLKTFMPEFGMGTTYNSGTVSIPKILTVPSTYYFDLSEWSQVNGLYTYKNLNAIKKYLIHSSDPDKYSRLADVIDNQLGHRVLAAVEDTKIKLTGDDKVEVLLAFLSSKVTIPATRQEFEKAIAQNTIKILDSVKECVKLSGVNPDRVDLIVLTGGSTEIPFVRDTLCAVFPNAKISGGDKLSSVGLGLAYDAARRFNRDVR